MNPQTHTCKDACYIFIEISVYLHTHRMNHCCYFNGENSLTGKYHKRDCFYGRHAFMISFNGLFYCSEVERINSLKGLIFRFFCPHRLLSPPPHLIILDCVPVAILILVECLFFVVFIKKKKKPFGSLWKTIWSVSNRLDGDTYL